MPRPKMDMEARRSERLNPRFTPAERLEIESAAIGAGMSAYEYVRMQALRGRVIVRAAPRARTCGLDELKRIGNNINQLARIANQTGHLPAASRLDHALGAIEQILARELEHDS